MRIICEKGEFELPVGFQAQYNWLNVILSDAGEQTQPLVLPGTDHNLHLVEHSDRLDNIYKPLTDMEVFVIDGPMHRACNMGIHSADEEDGISCTLYFDSGGFYSKLKNTRMNWLGWPEVQHPDFDNVNKEARLWYLINLLKAEYDSPSASSDFCMAPVRTAQEFTWKVKMNNGETPELMAESVDVTEKFCLNDFERYQKDYRIYRDTATGNNVVDLLNTFAGEYRQTQMISGTEANIDISYGMTPFLKLRYVLDFIFVKFGYSFDSLQLSDVLDIQNICVLNNVADALYGEKIYYRQLVPDTTIKEFLDAVEKVLSGKFVFDEVRKTVHFYFYKKVLSQTPDKDLTPYLAGRPKMGQPEFTKIVLTDLHANAEADLISESSDDTSGIEFNFVIARLFSEIYFRTTSVYPDADIWRYRIGFRRLIAEMGGLTHLNSGIEIEGELKEGREKESVDIFFAFIDTNIREVGLQSISVDDGWDLSTLRIPYKTSYRMYHGDVERSDLASATQMYAEYIRFRKDSNIPVSAKMRIPQDLLYQMNIHTPKLLNGQAVMLENIESASDEATQHVNLRTLRSYS